MPRPGLAEPDAGGRGASAAAGVRSGACRAGRPRGERGDTPLPHGPLHPCLTPLPQPLPLRRFQRALVSARCDFLRFWVILRRPLVVSAVSRNAFICTCQLKTVHFNQLCDGSQSSLNYARKSIENRPKNKQSRPKISAQSVQNKYILRPSGPHSGPISGSLWQSASPSLPG